ncbi:MAG: BrnT family toxin [Deltaproteobacteria bacterium]|nr:BrnT family toxin [Deltaproteobacteria bacterium]
MKFEWDPDKAAVNEKKHGVTFHEAATVFGDPLAMTFDDPDHSVNEQRYLTLGLSRLDRQLIVFHTDRGDRTRIISARLMTRQEVKIYEEG